MYTKYVIGAIALTIAFFLSLSAIWLFIGNKLGRFEAPTIFAYNCIIIPFFVVLGCWMLADAGTQPRLDRYYEVENPASYQQMFPNTYKEGYNKGYEEAMDSIKSMEIIDVTENHVWVSINGETHLYKYDK